jgi:predicted PurR-regulated permease PerM
MLNSFKGLPLWLRIWLLFPLAILNGWLLLTLMNYLRPLPELLVTALILAFLLNFPIQFLQQHGMPRGWAIALVLTTALLLISILGLTLVPLIVEQLSGLVSNFPALIESGSQQLKTLQQWAIAQRLPVALGDIADPAIAKLSSLVQATSGQVLNVILGTISRLVNIAFLLVLTIFMVFSGGSAWRGIFSWLPPAWSMPLQTSVQQVFQTYFAAQALLAGVLSIAQTIVFLILGAPYAVLFGVSIGLTTLIPYASAFTILIVSGLVALQDFSLGIKVLIAAVVIGQINDNVVSPRLVGNTIGLNPIWLIVSLFIGGKVAGVLGLVIAVPIASVIKQIVDTLRDQTGQDEMNTLTNDQPDHQEPILSLDG